MSKLPYSRALSCAIVSLAFLACSGLSSVACPDSVDPEASEALADVSLPPLRECKVQIKNGFPVPDPQCTPGAVNPTVTTSVLQDPDFRTSCIRQQATSLKQK